MRNFFLTLFILAAATACDGASDIRQGGQALGDRILVAGGGGGGGGSSNITGLTSASTQTGIRSGHGEVKRSWE